MKLSQDDIQRFREDFEQVTIFPEGEERETSFKDQLRIHKKFNSIKEKKFKLTWEYLKNHMEESPIDKKKIVRELNIPSATVNVYLCELNRYIKTQNIRWFAVPNQKDFIEPAGFNPFHDTKVLKQRTKRTISEITRTEQTRHIIKHKEELRAIEEKKKKSQNVLQASNKRRVKSQT
jgi:hypothetical protein